MMKIKLRKISGTVYNFKVNKSSTIYELKKMSESKTGIPTEGMRVIFMGQVLNEDETLEYYEEIKENQTLYLIPALRGEIDRKSVFQNDIFVISPKVLGTECTEKDIDPENCKFNFFFNVDSKKITIDHFKYFSEYYIFSKFKVIILCHEDQSKVVFRTEGDFGVLDMNEWSDIYKNYLQVGKKPPVDLIPTQDKLSREITINGLEYGKKYLLKFIFGAGEDHKLEFSFTTKKRS